MKFKHIGKGIKLVEVTQKEYDELYNLYLQGNCIANAEKLYIPYFKEKGYEINRVLAYSCVCTIINKYKYLKIID